jgi:peptidyl-prolyl cis-trans isomerase SurA
MTRRSILLLVLAGVAAGGVVIDRIAVVVGKHAIKLSDIERDLRVTQFQNREPLNLSVSNRKKAAERMIDQTIIADEMVSGAYQRPDPHDADALVAQLRTSRFGGSDPRMRQALSQYGLTEEALRKQLLWQLEVLRFIDERFRPGVLVTDDEVKEYYNQHRSELATQNPRSATLEALEPKIRETLEGDRINQSFEQWLTRARQRNRIDYRQEAFQ